MRKVVETGLPRFARNDGRGRRWLSKGFEKILWIVVGAALTALVVQWIESKSPDIVVRQYYNTVDTKTSVPKQVGELVLDYQLGSSSNSPSPRPSPQGGEGVYLIEVANEGSASEEDLRLQAKFPSEFAFYKIPDLKIYNPKEVMLDKDEFFMELSGFPKGAVAQAEFVPPSIVKQLCDVTIQVMGKDVIGRVEGIKGVVCE